MSLIDHSFFFTPMERDAIFHASSVVYTAPASLMTTLFRPVLTLISTYLIPATVAPNSITLCSTFAAVQAFHIMQQYGRTDPQGSAAIAVPMLILSMICSSVDGVHAKRCRSGTPLGDIFCRVCREVNHVFFGLTMCVVLGIDDILTTWYLIMTIQLISFINRIFHLNAASVKNAKIQNAVTVAGYAFSVTELSLLEVAVLIGRSFLPFEIFSVSQQNAALAYATAVAIAAPLLLFANTDRTSKLPIILSFVARVVPVFRIVTLNSVTYRASMLDVVADALVMGLLSIEIYVSFIAKRRIHSFVVALCVIAHFNALVTVGAVVGYVIGMLMDMSYSTNTPLFVPIVNVFIDGVFDLCHVGHKRLMENALKHGNRLIVGVLSDEDCVNYKRRPIMTTAERCAEVRSCKFVSEVVEGSPISGLTEEFLRKHNIHVVVHGEEYEKPDDIYYAVPRKMGITKIAPRTQGMSTSEIIKRISQANAEDLAAKDKLSGKSTVKE